MKIWIILVETVLAFDEQQHNIPSAYATEAMALKEAATLCWAGRSQLGVLSEAVDICYQQNRFDLVMSIFNQHSGSMRYRIVETNLRGHCLE